MAKKNNRFYNSIFRATVSRKKIKRWYNSPIYEVISLKYLLNDGFKIRLKKLNFFNKLLKRIKVKNKHLKTIIYMFSIILIASIISACIKYLLQDEDKAKENTEFMTVKVRVLENNTISFVLVPIEMNTVYDKGDTVWINLETHLIDDLSVYTMLAVIIDKPPQNIVL